MLSLNERLYGTGYPRISRNQGLLCRECEHHGANIYHAVPLQKQKYEQAWITVKGKIFVDQETAQYNKLVRRIKRKNNSHRTRSDIRGQCTPIKPHKHGYEGARHGLWRGYGAMVQCARTAPANCTCRNGAVTYCLVAAGLPTKKSIRLSTLIIPSKLMNMYDGEKLDIVLKPNRK